MSRGRGHESLLATPLATLRAHRPGLLGRRAVSSRTAHAASSSPRPPRGEEAPGEGARRGVEPEWRVEEEETEQWSPRVVCGRSEEAAAPLSGSISR